MILQSGDGTLLEELSQVIGANLSCNEAGFSPSLSKAFSRSFMKRNSRFPYFRNEMRYQCKIKLFPSLISSLLNCPIGRFAIADTCIMAIGTVIAPVTYFDNLSYFNMWRYLMAIGLFIACLINLSSFSFHFLF